MTNSLYFSMKVPMKIDGKTYRTCICYEMNDRIRPTVEKLAEAGKAKLYDKPCFFCNGKEVTKKNFPSSKPKKEKKEKKTETEIATVSEEVKV